MYIIQIVYNLSLFNKSYINEIKKETQMHLLFNI